MRDIAIASRFWSKVRVADSGCWEWQGADDGHCGYGHITIEGRQRSCHRVAWLLSHLVIPDGLHVLHHCDNPPCVNPAHLFLGTHEDNMRDRDAKGRLPDRRGVANVRATIGEREVLVIRAMARQGRPLVAIAAELGIDRQVVGRVVRRQTWAHVADEGGR